MSLRKAGNRVTIIDQFGPANSRSTSGDETRGIRSSYGDRALTPELWTAWARKSIEKWREFDAEHAKRFATRFFFTTGDVILREKEEAFTTRTQELWKAQGVKFDVVTTDDAMKRWPQIKFDGNSVVLYEPDAGVARARDSVQTAVALARDAGAQFRIGRVTPGAIQNGKMDGITLGDGTRLTADAYVFCCGPWMEKLFPDVMRNKTRVPIGHVCYFGTPLGDDRFTYPNIRPGTCPVSQDGRRFPWTVTDFACAVRSRHQHHHALPVRMMPLRRRRRHRPRPIRGSRIRTSARAGPTTNASRARVACCRSIFRRSRMHRCSRRARATTRSASIATSSSTTCQAQTTPGSPAWGRPKDSSSRSCWVSTSRPV